jgi:hypothetical protein
MMVIFLTGLVSMILMRTLRNDYAKYARDDDDLESLVSIWILLPILLYLNSSRKLILLIHPLPLNCCLKSWLCFDRRGMLMRNLDGNLSMVMYFVLLEAWHFFLLLLVSALSWQLLSFLWLYWPLLACYMLGMLKIIHILLTSFLPWPFMHNTCITLSFAVMQYHYVLIISHSYFD